MNELLAEGSKRFWDEAEEASCLQDCTAASQLAAASGELSNVTEETRAAVTGRKNNEHLFYRSTAEAKRRLEISREHKPVVTVDDILARHDREEQAKSLESKLSSAADAGLLADLTHETRVAVTGRAFPDTMMYRTSEEARLRIKAANIRARTGAPSADVGVSEPGLGSPGPEVGRAGKAEDAHRIVAPEDARQIVAPAQPNR